MPAISEREFRAAYDIARAVCDGSEREADAVRRLTALTGMNPRSASPYIRALHHMLDGEAYTRTLNEAATRYYLFRVREDYGDEAAKRAVAAVDGHTAYYSALGRGNLRAIERVADEFRASLPVEDSVMDDFERLVARSRRLGQAERRALLPPPGTKPEVRTVIVTTFRRNHHVVAEVRERAAGVCERCRADAPFISRLSGTPYLEVHHLITLAAGGDDTVENALALCPNCHREAHFG